MPVDDARRLTRSRDGRIVAGVCEGAARYFDIDPVILRVILAVLSVFGGAGILIYAFAWLLIPAEGDPNTKLERWLAGRHGDRRRNLLIAAAVFFVCAFLLRRNPFVLRFSGALFLVILVMAVATLVGRRRPDHPAAAWSHPAPVGGYPGYTSASQGSPTAPWPVTPTRPRPHSWLGWLILGTTFLVAGGFSIVGLSGLAHPQPADVLAAAVAVVGIGLVIGAVFGRAWLMIPVGLLLVGLLGVADAVPRNITWSAGNRNWAPVSADVRSPYVLGAGDATLDLSKLGAGESATVISRVGAGRLTVLVPRGTSVSVDARTSAGRILFFGHEEDGTGLHYRSSVTSVKPAAGTLTLNLQMGFGDVEVRDAPA